MVPHRDGSCENFCDPPMQDVLLEHTKMEAGIPSVGLQSQSTVRICLGKEWYRFPSSFALPDDRYEVSFVRSGFTGLLPKPFGDKASDMPKGMNAYNREDPAAYVPIHTCDYMVDTVERRATIDKKTDGPDI